MPKDLCPFQSLSQFFLTRPQKSTGKRWELVNFHKTPNWSLFKGGNCFWPRGSVPGQRGDEKNGCLALRKAVSDGAGDCWPTLHKPSFPSSCRQPQDLETQGRSGQGWGKSTSHETRPVDVVLGMKVAMGLLRVSPSNVPAIWLFP